MSEFHFLRPLWLLLLPLGAWLIWWLRHTGASAGRWRRLVDEALHPFVLTGSDSTLREYRFISGMALAASRIFPAAFSISDVASRKSGISGIFSICLSKSL